ncbi:Hypothetical protein A7982_10419 [Minicystis rosea]|nr:Hypothetical protein A7982_10419 [Minicystis rosea]
MGCGGGSSGTGGGGSGGASSSSASSGTGGSAGEACAGQPTDHLALSGTWVAYGQLAVKLQGQPGGAITICPTDQVGAASLLVMLTVEQNATDATKLDKVQATLCSIELPEVTALVGTCDPSSEALVSTQIVAPQSFLEALPKVVTMPTSGTLSGKEAGATLALGPLDVVVGSTKSGASLPQWNTTQTPCNATGIGASSCEASCVDDCTALRDDDMDTYPGVTVNVCGFTPDDQQAGVKCNADMPSTPGATLQGKAFIDIEVNPTFHATAKSSCELAGTVDTEVLYNVVGADIRLAGAPISVSSAIKSLPFFQVDEAASKFRMVRVDGQYGALDWQVDPTQPSAACKTINMRVNEL